MRQEPEFFGDDELDLLFMARRLREALKVEDLLSEAGIDYLVETGTYTGGLLFKRELTGAFIYTAPSDTQRAQEVLLAKRMRPYKEETG